MVFSFQLRYDSRIIENSEKFVQFQKSYSFEGHKKQKKSKKYVARIQLFVRTSQKYPKAWILGSLRIYHSAFEKPVSDNSP